MTTAVSVRMDQSTSLEFEWHRRELRRAQLARTDIKDALNEAFQGIDQDCDGVISESELYLFLSEAVKAGNLKLDESIVEAAVHSLFEDVVNSAVIEEDTVSTTVSECGSEEDWKLPVVSERSIDKSQFHDIFRRHPDMLAVFEPTGSAELRTSLVRSTFSSGMFEEMDKANSDSDAARFSKWQQWFNRRNIWLTLYVIANILTFSFKAASYDANGKLVAIFGNCIRVARGAALTINMNASLVLFLMCRHVITALRSTKLRYIFKFDDTDGMHKIVGIGFILGVVVHVLAHICDYFFFVNTDEEVLSAFFGDEVGSLSKNARLGFIMKHRVTITGIIMVVFLAVAYGLLPLRRTNFNLFWSSHHLLVLVLILMCIHGTGSLLEPYKTVYFVGVPLLLYLVPKFLRETSLSQVKVLLAQSKPGKVVELRLEKPRGWNCSLQAGMYAFLNIPSVSRWEWHPFTLTSSPEDDFLEFHIRCVGDWTTKLSYLGERASEDPFEEELADDDDGSFRGLSNIVVKVDGPMGAPSQGFHGHPVVVLIGAGIGITPMVSVVKSLLERPGKMQRVYFYWTVSDAAAFTWFRDLMEDIYERDVDGRIRVRNFLTSFRHDKRDLACLLLNHARRSRFMMDSKDILLSHRCLEVAGTGRPNWSTELRHIQDDVLRLELSKVRVFFCGPQSMGDEIHKSCAKLSSNGRCQFSFSRETF